MKQERHVEQLVSSGGLVYRKNNDNIEVVICGRITPRLWGLPKGTPDPGETREQTALREVQEETGLEVEIKGFIDSIEYWFNGSREGVRCHKTVHFYLMTSTGGDLSLHDHEFDVARWFSVEEALDSLTYENEVRIVQKGLSQVSENARIG